MSCNQALEIHFASLSESLRSDELKGAEFKSEARAKINQADIPAFILCSRASPCCFDSEWFLFYLRVTVGGKMHRIKTGFIEISLQSFEIL